MKCPVETAGGWRRVSFVGLALALGVACGGGAGSAPAQELPAAAPAAQDEGPVTVDLDAVFPPGRGRDLVLNNCQTCHVWVPIVILEMDEAAWARNAREHRSRVEAMTDEDFAILYDYLSSTFTPDRPVPELPRALLDAWTAY